jgi:hypothetical protein
MSGSAGRGWRGAGSLDAPQLFHVDVSQVARPLM